MGRSFSFSACAIFVRCLPLNALRENFILSFSRELFRGRTPVKRKYLR
jgi:hypothetical protein